MREREVKLHASTTAILVVFIGGVVAFGMIDRSGKVVAVSGDTGPQTFELVPDSEYPDEAKLQDLPYGIIRSPSNCTYIDEDIGINNASDALLEVRHRNPGATLPAVKIPGPNNPDKQIETAINWEEFKKIMHIVYNGDELCFDPLTR